MTKGSVVTCTDCGAWLFVTEGEVLEHECNGSKELIEIVGKDGSKNVISVKHELTSK